MWEALASLAEALPEGLRVLVIGGEGASFSAGLDRRLLDGTGLADEPDLRAIAASDDATFDATIARYQGAFSWWRRPELFSVAVVQGHAVGAGAQLAMSCDFRVAHPEASFALPEVRLGLVPDLTGTVRLTDLVGGSRALEMVATGRPVPADEAFRWGLVDRVDADLPGATRALVDDLLGSHPAAAGRVKGLLAGASRRDVDEQLAAERLTQRHQLRALLGAAGES